MDGGEGFVFQHKESEPGSWAIIGLGWMVSGALFVVALAIFALANWVGMALTSLVQYVGVGILLMTGGHFAVQSCRGVGLIIEAKARARAMEAVTRTERSRAKALEIRAATEHVRARRGKPDAVEADYIIIGEDERVAR